MRKHSIPASGKGQRMFFGRNRMPSEQTTTGIACIGVLLLLAFVSHTAPGMRRFSADLYTKAMYIPLRQRHWARSAGISSALPRFICSEAGEGLADLHATVVSIDRNPELQANLTKALEATDLAHQVFVGQDGVEDVPAALLAHYAGAKTRVRVRGPGYKQSSRRQYWLGLLDQRANGTITEDLAAKLRHRMEFALKVSFLQAMHRMVSSSWKYMLLLHEDAVLVDNFRERLQDALCGTPNDWQVLHLNACKPVMGEVVGDNIRQFFSASCTLGYAVTLEYAIEMIYERAPHSDRSLEQILVGGAHTDGAYIVDPPLVDFSDSPSIVRDLQREADGLGNPSRRRLRLSPRPL